VPHPSNAPGFYHPYKVWQGAQTMKILVLQLSAVLYYCLSLRSKYFHQHAVL